MLASTPAAKRIISSPFVLRERNIAVIQINAAIQAFIARITAVRPKVPWSAVIIIAIQAINALGMADVFHRAKLIAVAADIVPKALFAGPQAPISQVLLIAVT